MSNTTGELIRQMRKSKGITLEKLAQELKVSASAVSQYERGIIAPSSETLIRIARALKCHIEDIATKEDCDGVWALFKDYPSAETYFDVLKQKEHPSTIMTDGGRRAVREHLSKTNASEQDRKYFFELRRLLQMVDELTPEGQKRVFDYAEELTQIPRYQRKSDD